MPMLTRYQRNASLYADVLENPLIFQSIIQHLEAKDVLNVVITNAPFTKEERFKDTLSVYLDQRKKAYDENQRVKQIRECIIIIRSLLDTFDTLKQIGSSNGVLVTQLCRIMGVLVDNKWLLTLYPTFAKAVENKIIEHIHIADFQPFGIEYLQELFGVSVQTESYPEDLS